MAIDQRLTMLKMIHQCDNAMKYAQNISYDGFVQNELYVTFTVFALTQLGELATVLSNRTDCVDRYPDLPWTAMKSLRNHIVHDYDGLQMQVIWTTIHTDIPQLRARLQEILSEMQTT